MSDPKEIADPPGWHEACRRAAETQSAIMRDEDLWQAHCMAEQDEALTFMRSRILAGRAPMATALAMVAMAAAQWGAIAAPSERKHGEAVLAKMLRDAMDHGFQGNGA